MADPKPSKIELSARIAEAVGKFHDASMARTAKANAADEPTEPLSHYTTESALFSIIDSGKFWFISIYHMDDTQEVTCGFGVERKLLQEAIASGDELTRMSCEELADQDEIEKIKRIFEFYSVSFAAMDDAKQWEKYADKGRGIALGLAPAFFKPLMTSNPKPEETIFLGKVVYGEANAMARHLQVINDAIDQAHASGRSD
jgi:hypothetical protein